MNAELLHAWCFLLLLTFELALEVSSKKFEPSSTESTLSTSEEFSTTDSPSSFPKLGAHHRQKNAQNQVNNVVGAKRSRRESVTMPLKPARTFDWSLNKPKPCDSIECFKKRRPFILYNLEQDKNRGSLNETDFVELMNEIYQHPGQKCDLSLMKTDIPVIIGGIGDSGTRGVKALVGHTGYLTCPMCNGAGDSHDFHWGDGRLILSASQGQFDYNISTVGQVIWEDTMTMACIYTKKTIVEYQQKDPLFHDSPSPRLWGWKNPRTLYYLPIFANLYGRSRFKYIQVIRDGRDIATGDNQHQTKSLCRDFVPNCNVSSYQHRLEFWEVSNLRAYEYGSERLGKETFFLLRIEDIAYIQIRRVFEDLVNFLYLNTGRHMLSDDKIDELMTSCKGFEKSFGGQKFTEEEKAKYYEQFGTSGREGLEFFGYDVQKWGMAHRGPRVE